MPLNNQSEQDNGEEKEHEEQPETELLNFDKPDFVFLPKGNHDWRQRGPYIVCKSCEIEHASWIGMEKILVGIDKKGNPILKKRKEIEGQP